MEGSRQDVQKLVRQLAAAWREGDVEALRALLDERAVFVQPPPGGRLEGREACVESVRRFAASAEVLDYTEDEVHVDAWSDTAVATYRWRMAYSPGGGGGGAIKREAGRDVLVVRRKAGRWVVVWRTVTPGG